MSLKYVDPGSLQENVAKTKEHVESVRQALDSAKQNKMQFSTMPVPSAEYHGLVAFYTGATTANYTHNYCYECISDGLNPPTYSWVKASVQDEVAVDGITIQRDANTGELSAITATQNTKGIVKGGDGTSINAQGGVDVIDRLVVTDSLPAASAALVGKQRLYVGADTSNITKGGIYECQSNGAATPTYSWVLISTAEVDLSEIESAITSLQTDVRNVKAVIPNNASSSNKLAVQGDVDNIEAVIPSTASSSNKLVTQTDLTTAISNINALLNG